MVGLLLKAYEWVGTCDPRWVLLSHSWWQRMTDPARECYPIDSREKGSYE